MTADPRTAYGNNVRASAQTICFPNSLAGVARAMKISFASEATRLKTYWVVLVITNIVAFFWREVMGWVPMYLVMTTFYTLFNLLTPKYGRRAAGVITTTLVVLQFVYQVCLGLKRFGGGD